MNYSLICATGSYTYLGTNSTHSIGRVLTCSTGSYIVIGRSALMQISYALPCSTGTYTYTSQPAYLQVISLTALPPILYSTETLSTVSHDTDYKPTTSTSSDSLPLFTADIIKSTVSAGVSGAGSISTITDAYNLFTRVSDYIVSAETNSKEINKVLTDTVSVTDSLIGLIVAGKLLSTIISTSESRSILVNKTLLSTINTSETLSKDLSIGLSDIITLIDTLSNNPNKYVSDLGLAYDSLSTGINAQDYILREDGLLVLREDGSFFLRNSVVPDTSYDEISVTENIGVKVDRTLLSIVDNVEVLLFHLSKLLSENIVPVENIAITTAKVVNESITVYDQVSKTNSKPTLDSGVATDSISINPNKVLIEAQSTSDNISSKTVSKLLADSIIAYDIIQLTPLNSQTYLLREDGSIILKEDNSYTIREQFETPSYVDSVSNIESMSFNSAKPISDSYSVTDSLSVISSKLKVDTFSASENIGFVITNFVLRQDGTSYMLREDGSYIIREA